MWANTLCPFSSSTRNMALGSGSVTVPSTSMASFFGKLRVVPRSWARPTHPQASRIRPRLERPASIGARPRDRPRHTGVKERGPGNGQLRRCGCRSLPHHGLLLLRRTAWVVHLVEDVIGRFERTLKTGEAVDIAV